MPKRIVFRHPLQRVLLVGMLIENFTEMPERVHQLGQEK